MEELLLSLRVVPNSKEFHVIGFDAWNNSLKIKTKAKAIDGKANNEIIKELEKMFGAKITIVFGQKSRNKKIVVEKTQKIIDFLKSL